VLTMNSVKILHAVRSAITATAQLLVYFSLVSAPGHFCIAAHNKFSMYCIVLCMNM